MVLRVFYLCLGLLSLGGCSEKKNQEHDQKPLIVITSPDNPPFEFKDTGGGEDGVIGFDIDVIQKLEQHLGRPFKIVEADFPSLIPSLQSGRADMAIAELAPTEERRKSVDFSNNYYKNKSGLLVLIGAPFSSEKDLSGQKLGVQLGTSNEALGRRWAENIQNLSIVSLNKVGDLVQELKSGRLQAVLVGEAVAHKIASSIPGFKVISLEIAGGDIAIAFPKGSPLVGLVNEALKEMKGDIEHIAEKWISQ